MSEILQYLQQFDGWILLMIQNHLRMELLTPAMKFITTLGNHGLIWIVLSVLLLIPRRTRRIGLLSLIALAVTFCIANLGLKNYVARVRPYEAVAGLHRLIEKQPDWSFPSGHAAASFAAGVMIFKGTRRWFGVPCLALAFLIAFSRLYVGVHYPSDVIAGALIGTVVSVILFALFAGKKDKAREKKRRKKKKSW
jgi:membrane-associated phospholipid phosphatase